MSAGLDQLNAETARQFPDSLASFYANREQAEAHAASIKRAGRLMLLGMGGSHAVNRIALPAYRAQGIAAHAEPLSEFLRSPSPRAGPLLITSQSGASGEVVRAIESLPGAEAAIGLTLDPESPLGRLPGALIGSGGVETAYAATRSLVISLALHGTILAALGADTQPLLDCLERGLVVDAPEAVGRLAAVESAIVSGRGMLQGVAEAGGLSFMELARLPVLALELGQFVHGPFETLRPSSGLVLLRGAGAAGEGIARVAQRAAQAGVEPILLDTSGKAPGGDLPGLRVDLPEAEGLAAAVETLTTLQRIVIDASARRVTDVGMPRHSRKVTSAEDEA